jgi:hypothetical protein
LAQEAELVVGTFGAVAAVATDVTAVIRRATVPTVAAINVGADVRGQASYDDQTCCQYDPEVPTAPPHLHPPLPPSIAKVGI